MVVGLYIGSQLTGFFASVAKVLSREHRVVLVVQNPHVKAHVQRIANIPDSDIIIESEFNGQAAESDVMTECLVREEKYGLLFSELTIYDRSIGRGFLFNGENIPHIAKSWWSQERKYNHLLAKLRLAEHVVEKFGVDLFISIVSIFNFAKVMEHHGIPYLSFYPVKFGRRMHWADDETATSSKMRAIIEKALNAPMDEVRDVEYAQEFTSAFNHSQIRFTYGAAIKNAARKVASEVKSLVQGTAQKDSYQFGGWVPSILNKPRMFKYFEKYGKKPEDLKGTRLVYLPLSYEPEISLYGFSPEYNNSIEMIAMISRALPADMKIVVKEQPFTFGVRSKRYCDYLRQMPNVELAHPSIHSWDWVKASDVVATVTGTVGIEAVYFKRPVLLFGKRHIVKDLPVVRYAQSYDDVRAAIPELLEMDREGDDFRRSAHALYKAQNEVSFEMQGFEKIYKSVEPQISYAETALGKLWDTYPELKDK